MRSVLFVLGTTGAGGAENQCLYLLDALRGRQVDVELAYFHRGPQHERFESLGIPLHPIRARASLMVDFPLRARALRGVLARRAPDVLHTWLYEPHNVGLLAARGRPEIKVLLSHRSSTVYPGARKHLLVLKALRGRIDHAVANSSAGAALLVREVGLAADRVSVISNGVPLTRLEIVHSREELRSRLGIPRDAPVVCSVGRTDHQRTKDHPNLLSAMSTVWTQRPEARLVVVGPTVSQLETELGGPLPQQVSVVGWQARVADWLNAADVVVVHSRTEGHSNVADEALLLGRPVATTDTGDHVALVRQAGGRVVPIERGDLLGEAVLELIRDPPSPHAVRAVATEALSMDTVTSAFVATYERLTAPPSAAM